MTHVRKWMAPGMDGPGMLPASCNTLLKWYTHRRILLLIRWQTFYSLSWQVGFFDHTNHSTDSSIMQLWYTIVGGGGRRGDMTPTRSTGPRSVWQKSPGSW